MIYCFRCTECGAHREYQIRTPARCRGCGGVLRRDYRAEGVGFRPVLHGHFNTSVGRYVSGNRDFKEALKAESEKTSERMGGMPCNLQPVDISDRKALGVTDEGLDHSFKVRTDLGMISPKSKTFS